jgi:hypothetical protein
MPREGGSKDPPSLFEDILKDTNHNRLELIRRKGIKLRSTSNL